MPSLNAQISGESVTTESIGERLESCERRLIDQSATKNKVRVERKSTLFFPDS
jgi:hypothetical protein